MAGRQETHAHPGGDRLAQVPPSPEERKVAGRLRAGLMLFLVFGLGPLFLLVANERLRVPSGLAATLVYTLAALFVLNFIFAGRWPGKVRKRNAVDIAAPRAAVWAAMRFRETEHWWNPAVRRVDRMPGAAETYRLRYYNLNACPACGLPYPPESPGSVIEVEVLEEIAGERLVIRSKDVERQGCAPPLLFSEQSTYVLSDLPDGRTRVQMASAADRPRTWFALLLMTGDAVGEHLRALQGRLEHKDYQTLSDTAAKRIDAARQAEERCGCAPQTCAPA